MSERLLKKKVARPEQKQRTAARTNSGARIGRCRRKGCRKIKTKQIRRRNKIKQQETRRKQCTRSGDSSNANSCLRYKGVPGACSTMFHFLPTLVKSGARCQYQGKDSRRSAMHPEERRLLRRSEQLEINLLQHPLFAIIAIFSSSCSWQAQLWCHHLLDITRRFMY